MTNDPSKPRKWGPSTRAIHGARRKPKAHHSVSTPIVHTSNFSFDSSAEVLEFMTAKADGRLIREAEYARYGNPTQWETERKLAAIEGADRALLFSSGMSAVILALMTFLKKGDHTVFTSDCYRQTRTFADEMLGKFGLEHSFADPDADSIEKAIRPETRIVFSESPTNPYLRCIDLVRVVEVAKRHGCMTMIDSTLATPCNQRPLEFGVDLVIHSATKYLGGHNDLLAGVALGRNDLIEQLFSTQKMFGALPGALTCFLLERGLKTLPLRMKQHNHNGPLVARAMEGHPKIEKVWHPSLDSHPDHKIAEEQMDGSGSVISFLVKGGNDEAARFIDALEIFQITPSLGGTESLVTQMWIMSFFDFEPEERERLGIKDNLVRVALGGEDVEDLLADLEQALDKV